MTFVLDVLRANELKVKASKCSFGQPTVAYLGHIISAEGVIVDSQKAQCIMEWPQLRTLKALRGFLGLADYNRKFVRNFGLLAWPLVDLLNMDNFKRTLAAT